MKLEVGMYVRTKYGISKIEEIKEDKTHKTNWCTVDKAQYHSFLVREQEIIKARHKIINLIEEGDYVNGLRVEKNKYGELYTSYVYYGGDIGKMCEVYTTWLKEYKEDEIYSIVTKEQFSQMEYKVAE